MFGWFGKKKDKKDEKDDNGIVVVKKTEPCTCGGTDATQDTRAPKEIKSDEMILFDVTSALGGVMVRPDGSTVRPDLQYLSAFAIPAKTGSFLFLAKAKGTYHSPVTASWAYVKADIFPSLVKLVNEQNLAKGNGYHSQTHGLPQNFGGSVDIRYASGERISFSNNQCPIISYDTAEKIEKLFDDAFAGERVILPDTADICKIHFEEKRSDGGFTDAMLTILPDGTGENAKKSRYDSPTVYESVKPVDAETITAIRTNIDRTGMLAWEGLPDNGFKLGGEKKITFIFSDGRETVVENNRLVPYSISNGFFNIELEMTTKH